MRICLIVLLCVPLGRIGTADEPKSPSPGAVPAAAATAPTTPAAKPAVRSAAAGVRQIVAHRGSSVDRPENTVASTRRAIEVGATAVEVDVRTTRDGRLVLSHDAAIDRATDGHGAIAELSFDEIRRFSAGRKFDERYAAERVPSLDEVAELCRGRIDLLLDLKETGDEHAHRVVECIRKHGDPVRTIVGVRSVEQAKQFAALLPEARQIGLVGKPDEIEAYAAAGVEMIRLWPKWLADPALADPKAAGKQLVERVRKAGVALHLNGTTGEAAEIAELLVHRPESISGDDPRRIVGSLASLAGEPVSLRSLEFARPGGKPLFLDLYLPTIQERGPLPTVVWIHGGGWIKGGRRPCPAAWLAEHGFAVASIDYRLIDVAQWPAQIDDCRAAIRWLRSQAETYGLDARRFGAWGGSAGGHLAALVGTLDAPGDEKTSSRVEAVCDWYGPTDLLTMPPNVLSAGKTLEDLANSNGAKLLGGVVRDRPELAKAASAFYQASADDPPFLFMHGDGDRQVPLEQSRKLDEKLRSVGVPSVLVVLPGAGHGGPAFQTQEARRTIVEFFQKHLGGDPNK